MKLRVLYGGTFDPVHDGHLTVARRARDLLGAQVALLPAGDPPHKGPTEASAHDRAAMCRLAVAGERGLSVDTREVERTTPSWTVDTLRALRREIGDEAPVALIVGADSFLGLPTWKEWRTLPALAHFVVAERPGSTLDAGMPPELDAVLGSQFVDDPMRLHAAAAGLVLRMRQPPTPESATLLRQRIAAGLPWQGWVPPAVAAYIVRHGLYGACTGTAPGPGL